MSAAPGFVHAQDMMIILIIARLLAIVLVMLAVAAVVFVGPERLVRTRMEVRERFGAVAPYAGLLAVTLLANKVARDVSLDVSLIIGVRITGTLRRIDGWLLWPLFREDVPLQVVVAVQSIATPELTAFFSFAYVYGYIFLLMFPFVAYFALPNPEPLRRTIVAYCTNYLIGVTCYVIFFAYGPRNLNIGEQLLYTQYTEYQFVTTAINYETNVFPSLHASMAITAVLLAWTTREEYPLWTPVAAVLAVSVVVSTMYLGIHWATDAVFGFALAWISVRIGQHYEDRPPQYGRFTRRIRSALDSLPRRSGS